MSQNKNAHKIPVFVDDVAFECDVRENEERATARVAQEVSKWSALRANLIKSVLHAPSNHLQKQKHR